MLRAREDDYAVAGPSTSSEMVPVDQLTVDRFQLIRQAAACYEQTVQSVNVIDSQDVHVGPRFISVSQNIENIEVARANPDNTEFSLRSELRTALRLIRRGSIGASTFVPASAASELSFWEPKVLELEGVPSSGRILGLELVSQQKNKPLRCSVAVFVCWTIVVAIVLIIFICYMVLNKKSTRLDLDIHEPWYSRRGDWYANPDRGITLLKLPISMVIIGHSVREFCTDKYECIEYVLEMQKDHLMENRWVDIGPNFLVGGEGYVFEGRGANVLGEMVKYYNYKSISIMFLGNYVYDKPTLAMFDNLNVLLKELVNKQVLTPDYKLYGQCQLIGAIVQPGPNVMDKLHLFDHWDPTNRNACMALEYS